MPRKIESTVQPGATFRLGEWLVEPSLNRLSKGEEVVQLDARTMDVLVLLAERAGEVVTKTELVDVVWQTEFVADNTLTRRVSVLREALGDSARSPRFIETIPKRGYRLLVSVAGPEAVTLAVTPFPVPQPVARPEVESSPYPGLSAFTERDAEHFRGRDSEVATVWRKITSRRLLAVIGPSGVGKSSLARAGVIPMAPDGWHTLVFEPGGSPLQSLARVLAPEFRREPLLAATSDDPDVLLSLVSRWRERCCEALLVVDQFEELFTLSPPEVQVQMAGLLRRLADAADVHVVLIMRDDFLYDCHAHPPLAPIFRDVTPLAPPRRADLRRALIEPAERVGYRFENDSLAEEMVAEVADERGALPMLAFAVSQLWDLRDRERRLLTGEAYAQMGGVSGALGQHADATLRAIGTHRQPVVRELFRTLVTAKGTRCARTLDELLSVFGQKERDAAREVVQALIAARLLTSFEEEASATFGGAGQRRVEIVHESLLTRWPRLLRWQTQDAGAAQLRDQLSQAALLWHDRGRPSDLLWTGSSYRELRLWRERYSGGLTAVEGDFVGTSALHAGRRRRRRRVAVAVALLVALVVAGVTTTLWRRSDRQARRAEARKLFHIGQLAVDRAPNSALAWSIASLELEDDPEVRMLALQALWKGPKRFDLTRGSPTSELATSVAFSPDGRWLAAGFWEGDVAVWSATGGPPTVWSAHQSPTLVRFTPDSAVVVSSALNDPAYRFWSLPQGRLLATQPTAISTLPAGTDAYMAIGNINRVLRFIPDSGAGGPPWRIDPRSEELLQWLNGAPMKPAALGPSGKHLVYGDGGDLVVTRRGAWRDTTPRLVARHPHPFRHVAFHPEGTRVATVDVAGGVQVWSLSSQAPGLVRAWTSEAAAHCSALAFDPSGAHVVSTHADGLNRVWGIDDPPDADPFRFASSRLGAFGLSFDPSGRWMATAQQAGLGLWPFDRARFGHVLRGHKGSVDDLTFVADGASLVSASSDGTVRLWPVTPSDDDRGRILCDWGRPSSFEGLASVAVAPDGSSLVVADGVVGAVRVVSLDGVVLSEISLPLMGGVQSLAVDPEGRKIAVALMSGELQLGLLMWDMVTGLASDAGRLPQGEAAQALAFADDGSVLVASNRGLYRFTEGTVEPELVREGVQTFALCGGRDVLLEASSVGQRWTAAFFDLTAGKRQPLDSHSPVGKTINFATILAMDRACAVVATVEDRTVRVGPASGASPHLLLGHRDSVHAVALSPDGRWVASGSRDGTIRLWPVPDLTRPPLHTLPQAELLDRLRALTLSRQFHNDAAPDSYARGLAPFRGWEKTPEW